MSNATFLIYNCMQSLVKSWFLVQYYFHGFETWSTHVNSCSGAFSCEVFDLVQVHSVSACYIIVCVLHNVVFNCGCAADQ
jgi:hypothetical protein